MKTKRAKIDPMITMINVVFLLITFFMFGQFQKPAPISVTLPSSSSQIDSAIIEVIYIDETGEVYFQNLVGNEAITLAAQSQNEMQIHADKKTPANLVISVWKDILNAGIDVAGLGVQE